MIAINWPVVITTTVVLYALTILLLPFNAVGATVALYALIAFWSRLPGICILEPVAILYWMDLIDIFGMIIAIYVNPVLGAVFAMLLTIFPRICGPQWTWLAIVKDGVTLGILCLLAPFIFMFNNDVLLTVVILSVIRIPLLFIANLLIPHRSVIDMLWRMVVACIVLLFVNSFYAKLFGNFFSNMLQEGAVFSWPLFLVATAVIFGFATMFMGFSPKKTARAISKNVVKIAKKHIPADNKMQHHDEEEMKFVRDSLK